MDDIEESYVTKTEPAPNEQQDKELEDHQRNQQVKPAALETNTIASWETTGAGLTCDNNVMCLPNHLHVGSHVQDLKQDLTSIVKKDDHSGAKKIKREMDKTDLTDSESETSDNSNYLDHDESTMEKSRRRSDQKEDELPKPQEEARMARTHRVIEKLVSERLS